MDRLDASPAELSRNLADIARLNRIGADPDHPAARRARSSRGSRPARPSASSTSGTGAADIPLALARWARRQGHRVRIVALDVHPAILRYAARAADGTPEVHVVAGDALEPPIRPGSVDVALCSLVLHHLPEEAVVDLLAGSPELARLGFVVSDFRRGPNRVGCRLARHARGVP